MLCSDVLLKPVKITHKAKNPPSFENELKSRTFYKVFIISLTAFAASFFLSASGKSAPISVPVNRVPGNGDCALTSHSLHLKHHRL